MELPLKLEWENPVQKRFSTKKCQEMYDAIEWTWSMRNISDTVLRNTSLGDLMKWILPYTFLCICIWCTLKYSTAYSLGSGRGTAIFLSYLECHSKNIFCVSWSTQDGHADNILSEVYGAISILDGVKEKKYFVYYHIWLLWRKAL